MPAFPSIPLDRLLRLPLVAFAVALGSTGLAPAITAPLAAQELGIAVGAAAPDAPIERLDGSATSMTAVLGGKATVLEFWATWCGNCKRLEPSMKAAFDSFGDRVQFVTVAVSLNQTPEKVADYQRRYKVPFEFVYDRLGDASEAYDAPATSYVVIVNAAGRVVYTGVGADQDISAAIKKSLFAF